MHPVYWISIAQSHFSRWFPWLTIPCMCSPWWKCGQGSQEFLSFSRILPAHVPFLGGTFLWSERHLGLFGMYSAASNRKYSEHWHTLESFSFLETRPLEWQDLAGAGAVTGSAVGAGGLAPPCTMFVFNKEEMRCASNNDPFYQESNFSQGAHSWDS